MHYEFNLVSGPLGVGGKRAELVAHNPGIAVCLT